MSAAVLVAWSGCSIGMKGVDPNWDGTAEPECEGAGLFAADIALGVTSCVVGLVGVEADSVGVAVAGGLGCMVFSIGALIGEGTMRECREAKAQWRIGGAIGRASRANRGTADDDEDAVAAQRERARIRAQRQREERMRVEAPPTPTAPRGYFCAASPTAPAAGLCTREKADCERARDAALGAVPDMSGCTLTETAWCFDVGPGDERCSPTSESCAVAQTRHAEAVAPRPVNECDER